MILIIIKLKKTLKLKNFFYFILKIWKKINKIITLMKINKI